MFPLSLQIYKLLYFFRLPYCKSGLESRTPYFLIPIFLWKKRIMPCCKVHSFNMHELLRAYMHVIHIYSPYIFCVHPHLIFYHVHMCCTFTFLLSFFPWSFVPVSMLIQPEKVVVCMEALSCHSTRVASFLYDAWIK